MADDCRVLAPGRMGQVSTTHIVEIEPTHGYAAKRRLVIHAVASSTGREDGPIDMCQYSIQGGGFSPTWVKVSSLRPFIVAGRIIT